MSGGVDLKYLESFATADMHAFLRLFYVDTIRICRALSKPIIASVHGYAREGACTLAFACDMVIASGDSDFGYPGVPVIVAPPGMHTLFLQRLIGRVKAAELIFTGRPNDAAEADRLGLITRAVPADRLREVTLDLAREVAAMSPLALKTARDFIYACEDISPTSPRPRCRPSPTPSTQPTARKPGAPSTRNGNPSGRDTEAGCAQSRRSTRPRPRLTSPRCFFLSRRRCLATFDGFVGRRRFGVTVAARTSSIRR